MYESNIRWAIAHTWNDGSIDYITLLGGMRAKTVDGELAPRWFQERAAMVRIFDIGEGGGIGKRITNNMMNVYVDEEEYKQLLNLTKGDESEVVNQR